jgi:viroplasmin and RNaseH domain-containing protein
MKKSFFYAYFLIDANESGVVQNWDVCKKIIQGTNHYMKKFSSHKQALLFLLSLLEEKNENSYEKSLPILNVKDETLYFDSGTGRKLGVESCVTDYLGHSILKEIIPVSYLTVYGTYLIPSIKNPTNNYGELLALFFALKIALLNPQKYLRIGGDSQLILDYWSVNIANKSKLPKATVNLIEKVSQLRKEFEKNEGKLFYIEGSQNPADLGFHKS